MQTFFFLADALLILVVIPFVEFLVIPELRWHQRNPGGNEIMAKFDEELKKRGQ